MPGMLDLVTRETALVEEFAGILRVEQGALTQGDVEPLPALAERKAALAERLNEIDSERNALLAAQGHGNGRTGMAAWLAANGNDPKLAAAWNAMLALAREAQALNNLNGKLIALRLQVTGDALATLTQQVQNAALYGPDGQTAPSSGSRIIDSA